MTFGEVLDYYITKQGISRAELARRVSISRGQVSDFISGRTAEPKLSKAKAMADALGITLQEMVDKMEPLDD